MSGDLASDVPAGWDGLLDQGEQIVWQGTPDRGFTMKPHQIVGVLFGGVFTGFALIWMIAAMQSGGFLWMFGLIHFTVGAFVLFTALFGNTLRRRWTWYTLTDRRAFIATDIPFKGRMLRSYPINAQTVIDYQQGQYATILFGHRRFQHKRGSGRAQVGFERLVDGDEVMRLIRNIQSQDA